jgi:molybdate-binding protein
MHRTNGSDETANADAVANAPGLHDAVVIAFARREQGLLVAPGNPPRLSDVASVADKRARIALRPAGAGAQLLLLLLLLSQAGFAFERLNAVKPPCPTGLDIAQAVRSRRADCGIATRSVAQAAGLDFVPLAWEHFDLAIRHRDYFLPGPQALFGFLRKPAFRERAAELGGYDVAAAGQVRHLG